MKINISWYWYKNHFSRLSLKWCKLFLNSEKQPSVQKFHCCSWMQHIEGLSTLQTDDISVSVFFFWNKLYWDPRREQHPWMKMVIRIRNLEEIQDTRILIKEVLSATVEISTTEFDFHKTCYLYVSILKYSKLLTHRCRFNVVIFVQSERCKTCFVNSLWTVCVTGFLTEAESRLHIFKRYFTKTSVNPWSPPICGLWI